MSKMDNLRAMREARYAENAKRSTGNTKAEPTRKAAATRPPVAPPAQAAPEAEGEPEPALCGHRNMSGRTCTREQGHAAKSHRYS